jgi:iduronate 2-sulfatase
MKYLFALCTVWVCLTTANGKKPNVLFIVCDDLNTNLGSSGYPYTQTPNLNKLAGQSLTFDRAYCQYPVCGPSRASFLSGLYPESTGVLNNTSDIRHTRPDSPSMPAFFKKHGYWTGGVGKIYHNTKTDPGEIAWDENIRFENDELQAVKEARQKFEAERGSIDDRKNKKAWKALRVKVGGALTAQTPPGHGPSGLKDEQHKDGKNVRQVVEWLDQRKPDEKQPFFIICGIQKPHVPFLAPDKYFDLYPPKGISYEPNPLDDLDDVPPLALVKRSVSFGFEFGKENDALRREYMQAYHACITFVDVQIGLVLDKLKEEKLWDDTIIVFTSDHGYHLGEHYLWGKVTLFEESARVPLIIRVPDMTRPKTRSQALVELVDIFPTLAGLCDLPAPKELQGKALLEVLDKPESGRNRSAYTVVSRGAQLGRSVRTSRWRYAEWGQAREAELYDLKNDPREIHNLAQAKPHKKTLGEMRTLLARRQKNAASAR